LSLTSQLYNFVENLIANAGYPGIFALMIAESAFPVVPSEVVLPFAGYLVFLGKMSFWLAVIVASIGSLIGTLIDYYIGFYLGRAAILRYGRYFRLNEKHLATSERWFAKYGEMTVLLARFVPAIRALVGFPAGIAEMKLWKFIAYSTIGIVVWDAILIYLGFLAGQNSSAIINTLSRIFLPIEIVAVLIAIVALVLWIRRRSAKSQQAS
jgi:membrane protein DedA with SNARE-associated domain